jgi:hypothetical protein
LIPTEGRVGAVANSILRVSFNCFIFRLKEDSVVIGVGVARGAVAAIVGGIGKFPFEGVATTTVGIVGTVAGIVGAIGSFPLEGVGILDAVGRVYDDDNDGNLY